MTMILNILCALMIIFWAIELSHSNTIEDILPCAGWIFTDVVIIFSSFITPVFWAILLIIEALIWVACIWLNASKEGENAKMRLFMYILMVLFAIAGAAITFVRG